VADGRLALKKKLPSLFPIKKLATPPKKSEVVCDVYTTKLRKDAGDNEL